MSFFLGGFGGAAETKRCLHLADQIDLWLHMIDDDDDDDDDGDDDGDGDDDDDDDDIDSGLFFDR